MVLVDEQIAVGRDVSDLPKASGARTRNTGETSHDPLFYKHSLLLLDCNKGPLSSLMN